MTEYNATPAGKALNSLAVWLLRQDPSTEATQTFIQGAMRCVKVIEQAREASQVLSGIRTFLRVGVEAGQIALADDGKHPEKLVWSLHQWKNERKELDSGEE